MQHLMTEQRMSSHKLAQAYPLSCENPSVLNWLIRNVIGSIGPNDSFLYYFDINFKSQSRKMYVITNTKYNFYIYRKLLAIANNVGSSS